MAAPALQVILFALLCLVIHSNAFPLPLAQSAAPSLTAPNAGPAAPQQSSEPSSPSTGGQDGNWVETWTAVPESVKMGGPVAFQDTTIRQTIPIAVGAGTIRLTLSNAYGTTDLAVEKVTVALPQAEGGNLLGSGSIDTRTLRTVTFAGKGMVNVPRGGPSVSDPITFDQPLPAGQVISVSIYLRFGQPSLTTTSHFYSQTTSGTAKGDQTTASRIATTGRTGMSWYYISSVEALSEPTRKAFVIVGDSITDGRGSPINANLKWPSLLYERTKVTSGLEHISVVNQGAGGNQVVTDAEGPALFQPSVLKRLNRDVLSKSGLGGVMLFEGINDIGNAPPDAAGQMDIETRLKEAYRSIIDQVHAKGVPIIGATITPFMCPPDHQGRSNSYALDPIREQTRQHLNTWIRDPQNGFDHVADFDAALKDPHNAAVMAKGFIGPDCLHPSAGGYRKLASSFPLEALSGLGSGAVSAV